MPLTSPTDLSAADRGSGQVELTWTYAEDASTLQIRFDVYSSRDPLQPFRTLRVSDHAATTATLTGPLESGEHYFVVVARQGELLSLPSGIASVAIAASRGEPIPASGRRTDASPVGLGFPFRIDGVGRVLVHDGDPLLRGRILQLLLTAPGERVNLPEFGTRLRDLVFDPNNDVLAAATEFAVNRALQRFLGDRIHVDRVQVSSGDAELLVDISYLRKTDQTAERLRVGIPIPE
jgi:uncharacterized protein